MKTYITKTKLRNIIITFTIVSFSSYVYAANKITQLSGETSTTSGSILIPEVEANYIFHSSTSFVDIEFKNPVVEAKFILKEKVRSGIVQVLDNGNSNLFVLKIGDKLLNVETNATTTYYFGDASKARVDDIETGMKIYVFGYIKSDNSVILTSKIVIADKSRFQR